MIATNERVSDRTPALQVILQTVESDAQHRCRFATDAIVSVAGSETSRLRCLSKMETWESAVTDSHTSNTFTFTTKRVHEHGKAN